MQIHGSGAWGRIIVPVLVSETTVHNNCSSSSATTDAIKDPVDFPSIVKSRSVFVAALEDGIIMYLRLLRLKYQYRCDIPPQAPLQIQGRCLAALEDAELLLWKIWEVLTGPKVGHSTNIDEFHYHMSRCLNRLWVSIAKVRHNVGHKKILADPITA